MNTCNFSLALGLGLPIPDTSLSLAPTVETCLQPLTIDVNKVAVEESSELTSSQSQSATSYFSCTNRKRERERDDAGDEIEVEKMNCMVHDEDEDGGSYKKKLRLTKEQSALLEHSFKTHNTLNPKQKQLLARELNLQQRQVEVWFQNRRARTKLKQTEIDCEVLKKCCEALRGDNRRMQRELQELKAMRMGQPLYMQLPAATLTMCPSCERVGSSAVDGGGRAQKPSSSLAKTHISLLRHFANPSAAC